MNEFETKQAAYLRGFEARMQQLLDREMYDYEMTKEAVFSELMTKYALDPREAWTLGSRALRAGRSLAGVGNVAERISPKFMMPRMFTPGQLAFEGPGQTSLEGVRRLTGLARSNLGAAEGAGAGLAERLQAARGTPRFQAFQRAIAKPPVAGGGVNMAGIRPARPPAGFAALNTPLPAAAAAPAAEAAGAAGAAAAPAAAAGAAGGAGGFGSAWLNRLGGMIPANVHEWIAAHPGVVPIGSGIAGAAGMKGLDEYRDYQRRQALRNAGFLDRLGLSAQMLFNPAGAIQSMRL